MAESYWFRHNMDAYHEAEHRLLRRKHGIKGYGLYWYLIELLAATDDHCLEREGFIIDSICSDTLLDLTDVQEYINDAITVGIFEGNDEVFWSDPLSEDLKVLDEIRLKRIDAGRIGAETRWKETIIKKPAKKTSYKRFEMDSTEVKLTNILINNIKAISETARVPQNEYALQQWANDMDKLLRIDKKKEEQIKTVLEYVAKDRFWQCNILSVKGLRKHFDKLELQQKSKIKEPAPVATAHKILS